MWQQSSIKSNAMLGEKITGEYILDAHGHLGGLSRVSHLPDSSTEDLVAEMDRLGIATAIVFPCNGITSDAAVGNNRTVEAVRTHPDRLIGLAGVNPNYGAEIEDELNRCRDLGLRGVKLIADYQRYPTDGPNLFPAFEFVHEHGWIVINQHWGPPIFLDNMATTFSNACFIIGRSTIAYADLITSHDNIFQCTSGAVNFGEIEALVDAVGADKLIFGSGFPEFGMAFSLGPILYARISDEDKRKILGLNAKGILEKWPGK